MTLFSGCECLVFSATFGKEKGVFKSPDFPKPYSPNIDCLLYTFIGSQDEIIEITFLDFDVRKTNLEWVLEILHIFRPVFWGSCYWTIAGIYKCTLRAPILSPYRTVRDEMWLAYSTCKGIGFETSCIFYVSYATLIYADKAEYRRYYKINCSC